MLLLNESKAGLQAIFSHGIVNDGLLKPYCTKISE